MHDRNRPSEYIMGIDIGSTKIASIIATENASGALDIIAADTVESAGVDSNGVLNPDALSERIYETVSNVREIAAWNVKDAIVSVGGHITGVNSNGIYPLRDSVITEEINMKLMDDTASSEPDLKGYTLLHNIPQSMVVDRKIINRKPVTGVSGSRLEASVHLVSIPTQSYENINKALNRYEGLLNVKKVVAAPIASGYGALSKEEKDLGVLLVDIGGATSDFVVYIEGVPVVTGVFPAAGNYIDKDIVTGLTCGYEEAKNIKETYADLCPPVHPIGRSVNHIPISTPYREPRRGNDNMLVNIIGARIQEIFERIVCDINRQEPDVLNQLKAGIVLTGGCARLKNLAEYVGGMFGNMPVRIASGPDIEHNGYLTFKDRPELSTAIGTIIYALSDEDYAFKIEQYKSQQHKPLFERCTDWACRAVGSFRPIF